MPQKCLYIFYVVSRVGQKNLKKVFGVFEREYHKNKFQIQIRVRISMKVFNVFNYKLPWKKVQIRIVELKYSNTCIRIQILKYMHLNTQIRMFSNIKNIALFAVN